MQSEFMESAGFKHTGTAEAGRANCWTGHELHVTLDIRIANPCQIMAAILAAQANHIRDTNRQHAIAIIGPLARY